MDELTKGVVAQLAETISDIVNGKLVPTNMVMSIQDHSAKQLMLDGSVRIRRGRVTQGLNIEFMRV